MNNTVNNTKSVTVQILKEALAEDWVVVVGLMLLVAGWLGAGWSLLSPGALGVWAVATVGLAERDRWLRGSRKEDTAN